MKYINSSFNGSALSVIYRPSTFKNLHQLTSIGDVGSNGALTQAFYNAAAKRYIVKDKYNSATRGDNVEFNKNYIDDYLSSGTAGAKPVYNSTDWQEFEEKFLDEMRSLKTFNYALAKADITAMNDFSQYFGGTQITFPGKLFLDTTALENIPYGMYDFSHPYSLTESGFRNCTSLRKITSLF